MKHLIILIFSPFFVCSQDLNELKKISVVYTVGHYNFGDTGNYEKQEITNFSIDENSNFNRTLIHIKKRYVYNPITKLNDLTNNDTLKSSEVSLVKNSQISTLIESLNVSKDNFNTNKIASHISNIKTKEILEVATNYKMDFYFIDDESNKIDEVGRQYIRKIKSYDFLDSFIIKNKPSLEYEKVVIDNWNNLQLIFYSSTDTTRFVFQLYDLLGQPFRKTVNNKFNDSNRFINVEVNLNLFEILSKNSSTRKAISIDSLKKEYIIWYIKNRKWKNNGS